MDESVLISTHGIGTSNFNPAASQDIHLEFNQESQLMQEWIMAASTNSTEREQALVMDLKGTPQYTNWNFSFGNTITNFECQICRRRNTSHRTVEAYRLEKEETRINTFFYKIVMSQQRSKIDKHPQPLMHRSPNFGRRNFGRRFLFLFFSIQSFPSTLADLHKPTQSISYNCS